MSDPIHRPLLVRIVLALALSVTPFMPAAHAAASGNATAHEVVIKRDEYGVPHIYANSVYRLFYGYGYAVAQDRLFQMEMAKRSTQGTVAEVLGEKFVKFDQSTRGNYWPTWIERQIAALPQHERDILDGYAAGMNAYIAHVRRATRHAHAEAVQRLWLRALGLERIRCRDGVRRHDGQPLFRQHE